MADAPRKPTLQATITQQAQVKPNNYSPPGPIGNTTGLIVPDTAPNPTLNSAPAITPTKKEEGWWKRWGSDVVHGALDVAGFFPVLGAIPDLVNAGVYAAEGDYVQAGISAVAAIPFGGDAVAAGNIAVKAGKQVAKRLEKETVEQIEKRLAKEAAEKLEREAAAKAAKAEKEAAAKKGGKDKGNPCAHLRRGNGKGPYRGGSHNQTSKPANDKKDSHHAPAKEASPLPPKDGPAIQMDPKDHGKTSSNGQMPGSVDYREKIADLISAGKWREAMAEEIKDIRRVAREVGDPKKYNEAMQEMLEYFKCLETHGLLM